MINIKKIIWTVLLAVIIFSVYKFNNNSIFIMIGLLVSLPLIIFLSKRIIKKNNISNKIILCLTLLMMIIVCFFIKKEITIHNIINLIVIILNQLLIYLYSRRLRNSNTAVLAILLNTIISIVLMIFDLNNILLFIPLLMLYIIEGFDNVSYLRKKNIMRYLVLFISVLLLTIFNPIGLVVYFSVLLTAFDERRKKKLAIFSLIFITSLIAGLIIKCTHILNINDINLVQGKNIFIYMSIMFISLFILINNNYNSIDGFKNKKFEISIFLTTVLYLILNKNVFDIVYIIPVIIVYYSINCTRFRFQIPNFGKFIKPKNIKKVSVVIPNYNYARYIEQRIDSVLNQTYPVYEIIILDDCSKDNSEEVILKKIDEIKNSNKEIIIKYLPNKTNSGNVFKQWQKAFEVSTGDYLWIAEADDLCSKYFLNTVMKAFDDDKVVISYTESNAIDENGKVFKNDLRDWIDIYDSGRWNKNYIVDGKDELRNVLCINNTIANVSSVVFNKNIDADYIKYLKEAQNYVLAGDWYFYTKVLLNGKIAYSMYSYNYHRMHKNSVTTTTDNFVHYKEITTIQDSVMKDVKIDKKVKLNVEDRVKNLKGQLCITEDELKYAKMDLSKMLKKHNIKDDVVLSIIIPVYNVEAYIEKCLKSIFKSLPIKTEVIIINDGSPDNSEKIIKKYMENHKEIRYIKKENGGLSSVKNRGLKEAKGKYVIFLDSDDYVSSNMYDCMLKKIIDTESDIVYCDVLMTYEDGSIRYCALTNWEREEKDRLLRVLDGPLTCASWNKIVKRELYNGLTFPEGKNNEDVAVSPVLFLRSKKTVSVNSPFYKYVQRSGSIQNSEFNEKRLVIFDTVKLCLERIKDFSKEEKEQVIGSIITHQILAMMIYLIGDIKDKDKRMNIIKLFCEKYNELNIDNDNKYIVEYLKNMKKEKLLHFIINSDYNNINKMI